MFLCELEIITKPSQTGTASTFVSLSVDGPDDDMGCLCLSVSLQLGSGF